MATTCVQLYELERLQYDKATNKIIFDEAFWKVSGAADENAALTAAKATIPTSKHSIRLTSLEVSERLAPSVWTVRATYALDPQDTTSDDTLPPEEVGYSVQMVTSRKMQAMATVGTWLAAGVPQLNFAGRMGVHSDNVAESDGAEYMTPVATMQITHYWALADFPATARANFCKQPACINNDTFRGFAAGELLYGGCRIAKTSAGDAGCWRVDFDFLISPNSSNVQLDGFAPATPATPVTKNGWDWLWIWNRAAIVSNAATLTAYKQYYPAQVTVNRIYPYVDYPTTFSLAATEA